MPIIEPSSYQAPRFFRGAHVQTIYPTLFRKVPGVSYRRERIETPDEDFIDLDWSEVGSDRTAVILHGLEGDSGRKYMKGMARALNRQGWDAAVFNFRGCGGEPNRLARLYHSGDTDDVETVVSHVRAAGGRSTIALVGFSIGGNMILKYLGERGADARNVISRAVTFSVPCDLTVGAPWLERPANRIYLKRFLRMLCAKIEAKAALMPGAIDATPCRRIRTFREFDGRYTAPLHGFAGAEDYWRKASSKPYLSKIRVPALLASALDDPFLPRECYPFEEARDSAHLYLETPDHGGHCGFIAFNEKNEYWSETRAAEFLDG